jgi:hypothetical protein
MYWVGPWYSGRHVCDSGQWGIPVKLHSNRSGGKWVAVA